MRFMIATGTLRKTLKPKECEWYSHKKDPNRRAYGDSSEILEPFGSLTEKPPLQTSLSGGSMSLIVLRQIGPQRFTLGVRQSDTLHISPGSSDQVWRRACAFSSPMRVLIWFTAMRERIGQVLFLLFWPATWAHPMTRWWKTTCRPISTIITWRKTANSISQ